MPKRPLCVVCLLLMALMFLAEQLGLPLSGGSPLPSYVSKFVETETPVTVSGVLSSVSQSGSRQNLILNNALLVLSGKTYPLSSIKTSLKNTESLSPGTILLLKGSLKEIEGPRNPGEFNFKRYYASRNIRFSLEDPVLIKASESHSVIRTAILRLRNHFSRVLEQTAFEEAPLFQAIALGDRSDLPEETSLLFQLTGIIHILSISGLHIGILGISLRNLLKKRGAGLYASILIPLFVLIFYGIMSGSTLSTLRAVMMFLISSFGQMTGRIYDMLSALSLTAILMLIESPACLYDGGFQLSFASAAGVGTVYPLLIKSLPPLSRRGQKKASARGSGLRKASESLLLSLSVLITTLPITLYAYGEISVAGLFLNLLVIPAAGIILASAVLSMLLGSIFLPAGIAAALPGRALLFLLRNAAGLSSRLPFTSIVTGQPSLFRIALYYSAVTVFFTAWKIYFSRTKKQRGRPPRFIKLFSALCVFLVFSFLLLTIKPAPSLSVTCLDIGQGNCIAVRAPSGQAFLIDAGSTSKDNITRYQLLPFLKSEGISRIDAVFVSHTDADHMNGVLALLNLIEQNLTSITCDALVLPDWKDPPAEYGELVSAAGRAGVTTLYASRGDVFRTDSLLFTVLSPEKEKRVTDVNEDGMVLLLESREFSALFPGDIGMSCEEKLLQEGLLRDVDLLIAAHHGSRYSTGEDFLSVVKPEITVISCAEKNTYGHPAPETILRLENAGCQIKYTMKSGAVTVFSDDSRICVSGFADSG